MLLLITEWTGTLFGIAGAALLASNIKHSPWGWWLFLISSASLCLFAGLSNGWGLLLLNSVFMCTNATGITRCWLPHYRSITARPTPAVNAG